MEKAPVEQVIQSPRSRQPGALVDEHTPLPAATFAPKPSGDLRSALQIQRDTALEYDSMVLLSALEQLYIRLNDKMMYASTPLALEYLVNLTNQLIAFTEKLPFAMAQQFTLDVLISRDRQHYSHLGPQHVRAGRLSFPAFEESALPHGGLQHPQAFQQLSRDLLRVINICLNMCVKAFHTPAMQQQWRTVYAGFLVNLARVIQRLSTPPTNSRGA